MTEEDAQAQAEWPAPSHPRPPLPISLSLPHPVSLCDRHGGSTVVEAEGPPPRLLHPQHHRVIPRGGRDGPDTDKGVDRETEEAEAVQREQGCRPQLLRRPPPVLQPWARRT